MFTKIKNLTDKEEFRLSFETKSILLNLEAFRKIHDNAGMKPLFLKTQQKRWIELITGS